MAPLAVDDLALRDGERDGAGPRGDEADPVPGPCLLGWRPPGLLLLLRLGAAAGPSAALRGRLRRYTLSRSSPEDDEEVGMAARVGVGGGGWRTG